MQSVLWVFAGVFALTSEVRRVGPAGVRRFHELDPERARAVVELYRSRWWTRLLAVWVATNAAYGVAAIIDGDRRQAAVSVAAVVLLTSVLLLHRHNATVVLREAGNRELAPAPDVTIGPRDSSRRRSRRQRQFGTVAVAGLASFPIVVVVAELTGSTVLLVLGLAVLLVAVLAGLAFGWATVWVYGDERPA